MQHLIDGTSTASSVAEHIELEAEALQIKMATDKNVLRKLYLSHTLSTWNARTFEFGAVIFLGTIFPGTLFYASCYALFRSLAAFLFSSTVGHQIDIRERLGVVRQSIIWQRVSVATSCLVLLFLSQPLESSYLINGCFVVCVLLACCEKLAFVGNTIAVERDWVVVVAEAVEVPREDLNSVMRRIDLVCKLVAPLTFSLIDAYSSQVAMWVVFAQNALSVVFEYFAIAQVFTSVPKLADGKKPPQAHNQHDQATSSPSSSSQTSVTSNIIRTWKGYVLNPAFLASFSLAILYLTVLSFGSQMTTYLLALGFTSLHISAMRLIAVLLELSATCAAPMLMRRIGAVRAGLWFINEQLITIVLALGIFTIPHANPQISSLVLVVGVTASRLGLWGFDLCVQYLVQQDTPEETRGSFSSVEASLQSLFELLSFATTMIFAAPDQFKYPVYVSVGAIAVSAACFAGHVRKRRGHLLHTSKCLERRWKNKYTVLPTIQEEDETELGEVISA